jgi:hypothetical protein
MNRSVLAFVIAPLAALLILLPYIRSLTTTSSSSSFALVISAVMTYGGAIIFGLPIYLFLRAHHWAKFWIAPIVGFIVGAATWLTFSILFVLSLGEGMFGVRLVLSDVNILRGVVWPGGLTGVSIGILFWLIARPDKLRSAIRE